MKEAFLYDEHVFSFDARALSDHKDHDLDAQHITMVYNQVSLGMGCFCIVSQLSVLSNQSSQQVNGISTMKLKHERMDLGSPHGVHRFWEKPALYSMIVWSFHPSWFHVHMISHGWKWPHSDGLTMFDRHSDIATICGSFAAPCLIYQTNMCPHVGAPAAWCWWYQVTFAVFVLIIPLLYLLAMAFLCCLAELSLSIWSDSERTRNTWENYGRSWRRIVLVVFHGHFGIS